MFLAKYWTEAGTDVDIFLYESNDELISSVVRDLRGSGVQIFKVEHRFRVLLGRWRSNKVAQLMRRALLVRTRSKMVVMWNRLFYLSLRIAPARTLFPANICDIVAEQAKANKYVAIIGVEKGGVSWAGMVAERTGTPIIYYSLELYTWGHHYVRQSLIMRSLKRLEVKNHRNCAITIVQDSVRAAALIADNSVSKAMPIVLLPVSADGPSFTETSNWLQKKFGFGTDDIVIISLGQISLNRGNGDLVEAAQRFPREWHLVFHGYGPANIIDALERRDEKKCISLSMDLVKINVLPEIIASADIGLAFYDRFTENDRLTGFASEKIAMYLQCGVPVIAGRLKTYEHIEDCRAGILIDEIEELPIAISKIIGEYEEYRRNAFECYERYYRMDKNAMAAIDAISKLLQTNGAR